MNGGLSEIGRPVKRYQYLLLDPQDIPYTKFHIYCVRQEELEHGYLIVPESSPCASESSSSYYDADTSPIRSSQKRSKRGSMVSSNKLAQNHSRDLSDVVRDSVEDLTSPSSSLIQKTSPSRSENAFSPLRLLSNRKDQSPTRSPTQASSPTLPEDEEICIHSRSSAQLTHSHSQRRVVSESTSLRRPQPPVNQPTISVSRSLSAGSQHVSTRPLSPFTRAGFLRRLRGVKND